MEYQERTVQRVFSIRFSRGEKIIECLEKLVAEKGIRTGIVLFLGAFTEGDLVFGVKKHPPAEKDFDRGAFSEHREALGIGGITWADGKPKIHLHAGLAIRQEVALVHIVEATMAGAEVFILELSGTGFTSAALI
jgi:predicted DNA-binding protein with PD1-like motif